MTETPWAGGGDEVGRLARLALLTPVAERAAFLDSASAGDLRLRARIEAAMSELEGQSIGDGVTRASVGATLARSDAATLDSGGAGAPDGERPSGPTGQRRLGDYDLLGELGAGGMGVVYLAKQRSANRTVALKVIRPDRLAFSSSPRRAQAVARFRAEAQAAAGLDHDHIVTVYDVGEAEGSHYYAMRYVAGRSLADRLREGPIEPRAAARYMLHVARAVQCAHAAGILHRDLKPHNVLIDEKTDRAMVGDFGLAKLVEAEAGVTVSGEVFGSPPYMSPEQATDASRATARSDVWGMGATLYHLITGRPPFQAASIPQTLRLIHEQEPVAPRELNPTIDRDLETVCLKCLEKEPARRYASAEALAAELERYLNDEPVLARPASSLERARKFARRNRVLVRGVAATVAALVLGLTGTSIGMGMALHAQDVAQTETGKARDAERKLREEVLDSYVRLAELARQRGQWDEALTNIDKALAGGHRDAVRLRLRKMDMLMLQGRIIEARAEIEALGEEAGEGPHAGAIALNRGLVNLALSPTPQEADAAIALIRQSLESKVAPADEAMARAMLADTPVEAVRHVRRGLEEDPFNYDMNMLLGMLLAATEGFESSLRHVEKMALLFPEDAEILTVRALLLGMLGRPEEAAAIMDDPELPMSAGSRQAVQAVLAVLEDSPRLGRAMREARNPAQALAQLTGMAARLTAAMDLVSGREDERRSPGDLTAGYMNLPMFRPVLHLPPRLAFAAMTGSSVAGVLEDTGRVVTYAEIGAGLSMTLREDAAGEPDAERRRAMLVEAVAVCDRAMSRPQGLPRGYELVRFQRLRSLATLEIHDRPDPYSGQPSEEIRRRVREDAPGLLAWLLLSEPAHPFEPMMKPTRNEGVWALAHAATVAHEHTLARSLLDWADPPTDGDRRALAVARAATSLRAGAPLAALREIEPAVAIDPEHADVKRVRAAAEARVREILAARGDDPG